MHLLRELRDTRQIEGEPILVADGEFDPDRVSGIFFEASAELPAPIRDYVADKLAHYPED